MGCHECRQRQGRQEVLDFRVTRTLVLATSTQGQTVLYCTVLYFHPAKAVQSSLYTHFNRVSKEQFVVL